MRGMNEFESGVVQDHGAATFNAAFGQAQGHAGVGYVQDRTLQQQIEHGMQNVDERREQTRGCVRRCLMLRGCSEVQAGMM